MKLVEYITTFREFYVVTMSSSKSNAENTKVESSADSTNEHDNSLEKAILTYKKIYEKEEMS